MRGQMPQSRRAGSILNGLGQSDLEESLSYYNPDLPTAGTAAPSPSLQDFLAFGSALLQPRQQQQIVQPSYRAPSPTQNPMMVPLLVAAGLAAVFILSRK